MRTAIEQESKEKAGWMECFNPRRKQLYRTLLCMTLQMFQQLTGANYFFYVSLLAHQKLLIFSHYPCFPSMARQSSCPSVSATRSLPKSSSALSTLAAPSVACT